MLSFEVISKENLSNIIDRLADTLGDAEIVGDILESFLEISEEGAEVAVTAGHGMLLVRIYDGGRYSFVYPIELGESYDADAALIALSEYAIRELIPFYLTDTPREELERLSRLFSHVDARAYDEDVDSFVALVYSECDMLEGVPALSHDGIYLDEITEADIPAYAALARSESVNRYWGYDYSADAADAPDEYFLRTAEGEFARGIALSVAVREGKGKPFIGEGVIFDFDYRGGAKLAIRLLEAEQGRGVGSRAFGALVALAREIGLERIYAEVMCENERSVRVTAKHMNRIGESCGTVRFEMELGMR